MKNTTEAKWLTEDIVNYIQESLPECSPEDLSCFAKMIEPRAQRAFDAAKLTEDEVKFLQACYADSCNEGCFNPGFREIDFESVEASLIEKGVLREVP